MLRQDEQASVSSDLEDCKELWMDEVDHYMLESTKRYQRVEDWFYASLKVCSVPPVVFMCQANRSLKERTSLTAQRMSHYYSEKIARLPLQPPSPSPPIPPPQIDEYSYPAHPRDYSPHGYDAPYIDEPYQEHEADDPPPTSPPQLQARAKPKGKIGEKRPAAQMIADGMDEIGALSSTTKHAIKKRKLESGTIDLVADEEQLLDSEVPKLQPIPPSVKLVRGKLVPFTPRDTSLDIVPPGKYSRKKPGPKKKVPIAPELAQEMPSVPPSVAGDITPNASRAATPAPAHSGVIFEMDEVIPSLKKAKKMDDSAVQKRVKALEDAQRKVWTTIARRDVVKVDLLDLILPKF